MISRHTPEGIFLYVSPSCHSLLGYNPDEMIGTSTYDYVHPEDIHNVSLSHITILENPVIYTVTYRFLRRNGEYIWFETTSHSIFDEKTGIISEIQTSSRDITARKKTEEELVESKKMLQLVLDTIPARVFWKDRNSIFMGCNRLFALDAGRSSPDGIIGKSDFELPWKDRAEHYRSDDLMVMETGKPKLDYEESQTKPDGKSRYLKTSKIPLYDREGHVVGLLGTYEDITDRKKSEEERRKLEKKMEHTQKLESLGVLA
jgi:PAS domain S-box-containing protein